MASQFHCDDTTIHLRVHAECYGPPTADGVEDKGRMSHTRLLQRIHARAEQAKQAQC